MVWSAVGFSIVKVVSNVSSVAPSKVSGFAPWTVPFTVIVSSTPSPSVVLAEEDKMVKAPVDGVATPIGVLLIVPAVMVRLSLTLPSLIEPARSLSVTAPSAISAVLTDEWPISPSRTQLEPSLTTVISSYCSLMARAVPPLPGSRLVPSMVWLLVVATETVVPAASTFLIV